MIDSHTHLDLCEKTPKDSVATAERIGVKRLLTVSTDADSARQVLQLSEDFPQVYAAIGRHPNNATGFDDADLAELEALAVHERCVAIGETGLDYYREHAPRTDQERAFVAQIELAREVKKPLMIHTRAAAEGTLDLLAKHADGLPVIIHCFSLTDRLEECLERDYWCSFAGNVTYPNAADLRMAAAKVPLERLLVETDAPFLSPQIVRGQRNEPANVVYTAELLAELRSITYAELEAAIERNAAELFKW